MPSIGRSQTLAAVPGRCGGQALLQPLISRGAPMATLMTPRGPIPTVHALRQSLHSPPPRSRPGAHTLRKLELVTRQSRRFRRHRRRCDGRPRHCHPVVSQVDDHTRS